MSNDQTRQETRAQIRDFASSDSARLAHNLTFEEVLKHSAKRRIPFPEAVAEMVAKKAKA